MITFTNDADKTIDKLRLLPDTIEQGASIGIHEGQAILQGEIIHTLYAVGAIASKELLKSITVSPITLGINGITGTISSDKEYAAIVEEGRRPGSRMPPRDEIIQWMIHKGLEPSESGAYLIARKIARDGIIGRHPFKKAIDRAMPQIEKEVAREIAIKIADLYTGGRTSAIVGGIRQFKDRI